MRVEEKRFIEYSRKPEAGFTLIEMMIVLMIISVLLLIAVPSLTKNTSVANEKGCDAVIELLQGQAGAYLVAEGKQLTDLGDLVEKGYVDTVSCPDGTALTITNGVVGKND
ncbi:competence protein ComG [Alteribacter lacisalsi]|jgi:competence protein ComGC|uniref:ComG operon protein 3 n=1 Tax=Alteribacter lacisalsi TaxID=2045244 RepID=A0A2W0HP05_9BACI|nr:competence type IV pilus major pilin ComGC [Alteribacter lacisalsi]PYZ98609.1 competence protein ComG [Alteribacter lacisalsi]